MQSLNIIYNHLEAVKVLDIKFYDFKGSSPFYDYFIVATSNERKANAIWNRLKKEKDIKIKNIEGLNTNWTLIDLGDIIIHLFTPAARKEYDFDMMFLKYESIIKTI